jgi:hypothetical protein
VSGSQFSNVGYIAIRFFVGGRIENNVIDKAGQTLGDCGAIYTFDRDHMGLRSTVSDNTDAHVLLTDWGNVCETGAVGCH